jgi:hypothetical protein
VGEPPGDQVEDSEKRKKKATVSKELKAKMRAEGPKGKILHVMYKYNRPGNATTVEGFTGHKIPKGIVQNTLDELAKSGELRVKEGKNKIYWFNQDLFKSKGLDLINLNKQVEESTELLKGLQDENGSLQKDLRQLESFPADEDLGTILEELTTRWSSPYFAALTRLLFVVPITSVHRHGLF